jgi:hypothetical protein
VWEVFYFQHVGAAWEEFYFILSALRGKSFTHYLALLSSTACHSPFAAVETSGYQPSFSRKDVAPG